ncbi:CDK5RAP1-like protein [Caenorhabditis elegans]|uniref:CDK5RAP1-like protein n=1 Tax=Caenorhabditis elegans TaxID=6239 RepID=CK5P1_CAEEL|nr:CDK5RAP1-like protein [Caenorhabditis elegans]Q09316.1 RecName: Full=CDK5RAP1-like protein [Caenorhabditis elegans]CCD68781.1 CDK5RAP1-like protein [Caenorhabditis elegans]|eukprot:NP_498290.1 CDK5RAP1-like protein [Caenorhabditis elegans]
MLRQWWLRSVGSCSTVYRAHSGCSTSAAVKPKRAIPTDGLQLSDFIKESTKKQRQKAIIPSIEDTKEYLNPEDLQGNGRTVCYVTYGCQMNVSDMEIVRSIMTKYGFVESDKKENADIVLLMTCSIRDGAEKKVWNQLKLIRSNSVNKGQIVGVLGCMAERVRHDLLEKRNLVNIVAGPDSYRDLPRLVAVAAGGSNGINVQLSLDETYADVQPIRVDSASKTAFISIMRGCDNMCTYCVVPFTRGRERSRPIESIVEEVQRLRDQGYKQVTLLGQNVNSYRDMTSMDFSMAPSTSQEDRVPGFKTVYKPKSGGLTFTTLLEKVADAAPDIRFRFTSPHPKDFPMQLIELIASRPNLCKQLHLPAQSGDDETLERMERGYTRDLYLRLVDDIRHVLPSVSLTSDFIAGFCGETEQAHQNTLSLIRAVRYSFCFVFPYSMRGKTRAHHRLTDDVPEDVKARRHLDLTTVFREEALKLNQALIGSEQTVLLEGKSKRDASFSHGRIDGGVKAVFDNSKLCLEPGQYAKILITDANSQTLKAQLIGQSSI